MAESGPASDPGGVTLQRFLDALPPGWRLLHDGGTGSRVRWVEPSELDDPTPFLLDGEMVLTAGMPFLGSGAGRERIDAYVERLIAAKVCALGFGLTPYLDDVPAALVESCRNHGLTLVEIPPEVPFAALGLEFSRLLETENLRVLRNLADANRQLLRAVLSARPEAAVLRALVALLPAWCVLVGPDGKLTASAGGGIAPLPDLQPLLARLRAGSGPRIEVAALPGPQDWQLVGYPLRSERDTFLGALLLGSKASLAAPHSNIASMAVGLLELMARQRSRGATAPGQLATALLLYPEPAAAESAPRDSAAEVSTPLGSAGPEEPARGSEPLARLVAQSVSAPRPGPLRVVLGFRAAGGAASAPDDGDARVVAQWRRLLDTRLVLRTREGIAAVTRLKVDDQVLREAESQGWLLTVSEPCEVQSLAWGRREAAALVDAARTAQRSQRASEQMWSVAGLLGAEAGSALASKLLSPVLALPPEKSAALLAVLRGWLGTNGNWDSAAKELGLHRNTVRRLAGQAAELLGCDLSSPDTRAELWIALKYVPAAGYPADQPG